MLLETLVSKFYNRQSFDILFFNVFLNKYEIALIGFSTTTLVLYYQLEITLGILLSQIKFKIE